jgi:hypothetical protein
MLRASILPLAFVWAFVGTVSAPAPAPPAKATLLRTGLLGMGVEPAIYPKFSLLHHPEVQQELKLSVAQIAQLKAAEEESDRVGKLKIQESQKLDRELRARGDAEGLAAMLENAGTIDFSLTTESERPLVKVLDARQRTRLEQLQLQGEGPLAFRRPVIHERLNMSPGQIEMIETIITKGREAMNEASTVPKDLLPERRRLTPDDRAKLLESEKFQSEIKQRRAAVLKARQNTMLLIGKQLTKNQRANFDKMLGEPFDFAKAWPAPASSPPVSKSETKSP